MGREGRLMKDLRVYVLLLAVLSTEVHAVRQRQDEFENMRFRAMASSSQSASMSASALLGLGQIVKRMTTDGRMCASAFVQDGVTYTDCTTTRSPDLDHSRPSTEKEWCYVDGSSAGGGQNWNWCAPKIAWDDVRNEAKKVLNTQISNVKTAAQGLTVCIPPCELRTQSMRQIETDHGAIDGRLNRQEGLVKAVKTNLDTLSQTDQQKKAMIEQQEALKQEILDYKEKEQAACELHAQMQMEGKPMNPIPFDDPNQYSCHYDCEGMLGYEDDADGDGVHADYFANLNFGGAAFKSIQAKIDFDWQNAPPVPGVAAEMYSVRWTAFVKAPASADYVFRTRGSDGARVFINGQLIINDRMPAPPPPGLNAEAGSAVTASNWAKYKPGDNCVGKQCSGQSSALMAESNKIGLIGGDKYQIVVETFHTTHRLFDDNTPSFFKLTWKSNRFDEEVVPARYLYTKNAPPALKIGGYNSAEMHVATMRDGDFMFKDEQKERMADIPMQYLGVIALKHKPDFTGDMEFSINAPAILYIAVDGLSANPLPSDFKDTTEKMTSLRMPPGVKAEFDPAAPPVEAAASTPYVIYMKKIAKGVVNVPLKTVGKVKSNNFIAFVGGDPALAGKQLSCGGDRINLSLNTGPYFKSCSTSSKYSDRWSCNGAFNGMMDDSEGNFWATSMEGVGGWIEIKFNRKLQVHALVFRNRDNPLERNSMLELAFDDGTTQSLTLKNTNQPTEYALQSVTTDKVRIKIAGVFGAINNGGAFKIMGVPCAVPEQKPRDPGDFMVPLEVPCTSTLADNKQIQQKDPRIGDKIPIKCSGSCASSPGNVFGGPTYSDDSAICRAAVHNGQIVAGIDSIVQIAVIEGLAEYVGSTAANVVSKSKPTSTNFAFKFEKYSPPADAQKIAPGSKVDLLDVNGGANRWVGGAVVDLSMRPDGKQQVTVSYDGFDAKSNEKIIYPNPERIANCGEKVKGRQCPASGGGSTSRATKVNFQAKTDTKPVTGYLVDIGGKFEPHGAFSYGWSADMSSFGRERKKNDDRVLDTFVMFSPDTKSAFCKAQSAEVPCNDAFWSIKTAPGRYKVRVTVGDAAESGLYNIQVNKVKFVDAKTLMPNQFDTVQKEVEVSDDGILRVTSTCSNNCNEAWAKINAIEFEPSEATPMEAALSALKKATSGGGGKTQELGCGGAYKGGRCDDPASVDVSNCIWDAMDNPMVAKCSGAFNVFQIKKGYACADQVNKVKCIARSYVNVEDCKLTCPGMCGNNNLGQVVCQPVKDVVF